MRLAAYKRLVTSALTLKSSLDGSDYFNVFRINPRLEITNNVMNIARTDENLLNSEFVELYNYVKEIS